VLRWEKRRGSQVPTNQLATPRATLQSNVELEGIADRFRAVLILWMQSHKPCEQIPSNLQPSLGIHSPIGFSSLLCKCVWIWSQGIFRMQRASPDSGELHANASLQSELGLRRSKLLLCCITAVRRSILGVDGMQQRCRESGAQAFNLCDGNDDDNDDQQRQTKGLALQTGLFENGQQKVQLVDLVSCLL
jgi:hypothetical protein